MFNNIKNYLYDNEWKIHIYDKKINIVNYIDIVTLEDNRVSVKYQNGIIVIKGKKLSVNKMLDNEMVITGIISSVEFE